MCRDPWDRRKAIRYVATDKMDKIMMDNQGKGEYNPKFCPLLYQVFHCLCQKEKCGQALLISKYLRHISYGL
jgi:hypothetical protein